MEEIDVSVEQRFLTILGIADSGICEKVFGKDYLNRDSNSLCCFISFAYADLPTNKIFEIIFRRVEPEENLKTQIEIKAVTQQFGDKLNSIPYGWKTICILSFPKGIPNIFRNLPIVKDWYESKIEDHLCITNEETLQAILKE